MNVAEKLFSFPGYVIFVEGAFALLFILYISSFISTFSIGFALFLISKFKFIKPVGHFPLVISQNAFVKN